MHLTRLVQAVLLMLLVAWAASCSVSRDYTRKIFKDGKQAVPDTLTAGPRFLNWETDGPEKEEYPGTFIDSSKGRNQATKASRDTRKEMQPGDSTIRTSGTETERKTVTEEQAKISPDTTAPLPVRESGGTRMKTHRNQ